jgi:Right handed beta helix region
MLLPMKLCRSIIAFVLGGASYTLHAADSPKPVGTHGIVGTLANPKTVNRLEITKPGVYENYLIDALGNGGNIVKITADGVTLRNCEIRNATGNGVGVFGSKVVIENCRIHHLLKSTFKAQDDAHGITGHWGDVTIRNCDISHVSGDCVQFDPDRASRGSVLIEDCHLWTGPLPADALDFKAGERPGENAMDTKTKPDGERCKLTIRNCYMHGFNQPAQISTIAALNIKEHVDAEVTHCVFADCEVAFRVRGLGSRGGAHVRITECAIYETQVGVRAEDKIEQLKISGLAFGHGVRARMERHNGKDLSGFETTGEREAPPMKSLLKNGFPAR